ncbi:MAG: ABC transporter permease, partial [Lachnospiraceae bacterium]|nr:ABC transporter permease [Lachnospiraceae bacterium]
LADGWAKYNDSYAEFEEKIAEAEQEIADAEADIANIEKPETYVLNRDTNIGYACFQNDSSIVEGLANVFPVFFFLVAALVCMTTMNRMVEEQRTQIGVLKALGYGEAAIMGKYLFYSGSAALAGCIAGYFLGIHLFPFVIWTAYGMMYQMGSIVYIFDGSTALLCLACALLCSMGTTWISCRHELKEVAADLMRPKAPRAGKRVFLEWLPFIWKRLKFLHKVSVRNIVRYKRRFFMMVIGISGCTALLVTGFGIRDSVVDIADQQFQEIQTYQFGITLKNGIKDANDPSLTEFTEILDTYGGSFLPVLETTMDLQTPENLKSIHLIIVENPAQVGEYIDLHTPDKTAISYPKAGEAVICEKLAKRYRIQIGDTIHLFEENGKEVQAVVSGICENYIYNYIYLNAETYQTALGTFLYKNVYANITKDADIHAIGAAIMKANNITAVSINADMLVRFSSMMSSMNYIVFVVIACAAALAFIVLYNLNNINITERIREIATIKVLGFYRNETAAYVFRENTALTAIGCAVGLLLGKLLHIYVMHKVDIDLMSFDVHVKAVSYLLSILLTFAFTWIVNRIMTGKLENINMAESLKSVD